MSEECIIELLKKMTEKHKRDNKSLTEQSENILLLEHQKQAQTIRINQLEVEVQKKTTNEHDNNLKIHQLEHELKNKNHVEQAQIIRINQLEAEACEKISEHIQTIRIHKFELEARQQLYEHTQALRISNEQAYNLKIHQLELEVNNKMHLEQAQNLKILQLELEAKNKMHLEQAQTLRIHQLEHEAKEVAVHVQKCEKEIIDLKIKISRNLNEIIANANVLFND
jgi:hypothetical protein